MSSFTMFEDPSCTPEAHPANSNTIHVGEKPKSISFSGCGFLGVYHIGVASCIKQHAPNWLKNVERIYGCSAGSLIAAMLLSDVSFGEVCHRMMSIAKDARSRSLGPISPGFKLNETLLRDLRCGLPVDAHIRASGKLYISLTRVRDGKNVIVSDYRSRDELIEVLLCSCFVPFYSGFFPPKYRGVRYVDGGLSNNLPAYPDTITVSPWSGNSDICPRNDGSVSLIDLSFVNTSIQLTASNLYRVSTMFYPPKPEVLKDFCCQGFRETVHYLRDHGLFETVKPLRNNLSFSSLLHNREERRKITRKMSYTARRLQESDLLGGKPIWSAEDNKRNESESSQSSEESFIEAQIKKGALDECFDENDNECVAEVEPPATDAALLEKVYTVVHFYPVLEDHVIRIQFQLPAPLLEAMEAALDHSAGSTWKKPLSRLLSTCHQSFIVRIPLEQAYTIACFLLRHAETIPSHVTWLVTYLRVLVNKLQVYVRGENGLSIGMLHLASEKTRKEVEFLASQLAIAVQVLAKLIPKHELLRCTSWMASCSRSLTRKEKSGYNSNISPFLQMV